MNTKNLIRTIKNNKNLPKYIRDDLVKILKSNLYTDTVTIISTLDSSPKSRACVMRFNQLDPHSVRTKQQVIDFKNELTAIKNECLKCTINPYFFTSTRSNGHVRTLGDIYIPNSNVPVTINTIVTDSKYNYLDKPRMIKDYLIAWNRDAKKYLEDKVTVTKEYLAKSHKTRFTSRILKLGSFVSFIFIILAILLAVAGYYNKPILAVYAFGAILGSASVIFTSAVINSFHSRRLRYYDKQMRVLDALNDRYTDHTFDVEHDTMKKVYAKKLCNISLSKINVISPVVKHCDIEKYVYSHKYILNRKYWWLKTISFFGFVGAVVCILMLLSRSGLI